MVTQSNAEYYKNLPAKRMGSGVLFFNDKNEILIVQPTYKDTWEIPGGIVEWNESPRSAAIREVSEEIGLVIEPDLLNLRCVEYMSAGGEITESLMFIFSGGILSEEKIREIKIDATELKDYKFLPFSSAFELLGPVLGTRVKKSLETNTFLYSESGY